MGLEKAHGRVDARVGSLAAPRIGRLLVAFRGYRGNEVLHANEIPAEVLVDEGCVGEAQKRAIGMLLAEPDQVALTDEGLAPV